MKPDVSRDKAARPVGLVRLWTSDSQSEGHRFKSGTGYMDNNYVSRYPEIPYEAGPGWDKLIDETLDKLFEIEPALEIFQIKEKFGGLRIYLNYLEYRQDLEDIIDAADLIAQKTCLLCGAPGRIVAPHGWYRPACFSCYPEPEEK